MSDESKLDQIRHTVLDRIDQSERRSKLAFFAAVGLETCFLAAFLLLADFSNRLHALLFLSAIAVYSILALGLVALGAHVNRCTERVLKAIDLAPRKHSMPPDDR